MLLRYLRVLGLVAVAAATMPLPAAPPDRVEYHSVQVRVGDVDLSTTAGATELYGRLQRAARAVCGDEWPVRRSLAVRRQVEECKAQAIDDAVAQIDHPVLTDLHAQRDVDG